MSITNVALPSRKVLPADVFARLCRARHLLGLASDVPVTIEAIARETGMSGFHFIRQFHSLFGVTPHQYRIRARIDRAKRLLALGHVSVTDVCLDVGATSLGSFSSLFTQRVGVAPSHYRSRARSMISVPGRLPPALFPGCLSLMAAAFATFEKRGPRATVTLGS